MNCNIESAIKNYINNVTVNSCREKLKASSKDHIDRGKDFYSLKTRISKEQQLPGHHPTKSKDALKQQQQINDPF